MEGPSVHLRELGCGERRGQCTNALEMFKKVTNWDCKV